MSTADILAGFEPIVRDIFDEYEGPVTSQLSAKDVSQWDSLANVHFMVMVEKTFGIKFTTGEITSVKNLGELADLVAAKQPKAG